jgi:large subunit ribosomal protein L5e
MGYVRVVKNPNYYRRFKVKMRRRRECKTDYALRRRLITQDKRKYNAPKWRLVVRISNNDVTCQVTCAKMIGDHVLCAAYSHELKRYGLKVGLTNYAACYCTGLLIARRLLKKLQLDKFYPGKKRLDGQKFASHVANVKWKAMSHQKLYRPFKCLLDIGLSRASTGARVFGVLKGAVDGGLDIPHNQKRFPGYIRGKSAKQKDFYDASVHGAKIYGGHVRAYMEKLQDENPEKYNQHFSRYIAEGVNPEDLEDLYDSVHRKIRKDPQSPPQKRRGQYKQASKKRGQSGKISVEEKRQNRLRRMEELNVVKTVDSMMI